jgi:hypothetical protein
MLLLLSFGGHGPIVLNDPCFVIVIKEGPHFGYSLKLFLAQLSSNDF